MQGHVQGTAKQRKENTGFAELTFICTLKLPWLPYLESRPFGLVMHLAAIIALRCAKNYLNEYMRNGFGINKGAMMLKL